MNPKRETRNGYLPYARCLCALRLSHIPYRISHIAYRISHIPNRSALCLPHLVCPIACVLYKHDCDNYALAKNEKSTRLFIRACREGGNVLRKLGYTKRQPFKFNLFYLMPEFITTKIFKGIFNSKYAEIGFAMHAKVALDEMKELTKEFKILIDKTSVKTPNIDKLKGFIP